MHLPAVVRSDLSRTALLSLSGGSATRTAGFLSNGSTRWRDERAENRAGQQELQICGEAPRAVPASAAVEEFAAARAQERQDVLEVGCGARRGAERRRIERATARGEEDEARETAADLEAARADVLVRQPIAREMKDRTEQDRRESRPAGGAGRGARRHVKRDDHDYRPSRRPRETRADATSRTWRAVRPQDTPAEVGVALPTNRDVPGSGRGRRPGSEARLRQSSV
jgi:hypothetical protein